MEKLNSSLLTNAAADWLAGGAHLKSFLLKRALKIDSSQPSQCGWGAAERAGLQKLVHKLSATNFGNHGM